MRISTDSFRMVLELRRECIARDTLDDLLHRVDIFKSQMSVLYGKGRTCYEPPEYATRSLKEELRTYRTRARRYYDDLYDYSVFYSKYDDLRMMLFKEMGSIHEILLNPPICDRRKDGFTCNCIFYQSMRHDLLKRS
jgi:hypothetical protein